MAEDNNDQNVVQPQNNAQQAVPTQPADVATDNAETSVTEPIAVHDAGEQPTTTLPSVNAADSEIAPDYASAAGESTVVSGGLSTGGQSTAGASAQSQYRPAPEYGAYGTVPPQPTNGTNAAQPQYGQPAHSAQTSQMPPQNNRNPFFGNPYVNPQNEQHDSRGSNPFTAPQGGANRGRRAGCRRALPRRRLCGHHQWLGACAHIKLDDQHQLQPVRFRFGQGQER